VLLLTSALALGFVHGLGADHLMGIAALAAVPGPGDRASRRSRALGIALRFAIGHALLLGAGAAALITLGWSLPIAAERGGEMLGGLLLIVLGGLALWSAGSGHLYGHIHVHANEPAPHWHLHFGTRDRHPAATAHSHVPTIVGAAFAISSLRALTMLAPFGGRAATTSLPGMLGLVTVFAVGILLSMSLFGVAFARLMSAQATLRLGRASAVLMAMASIALGGYWIVGS
jgi:nickel/cobalt transporter (NicO) family protein